MKHVSVIANQVRRVYGGDAWHGPSLREALDGVTAEQAAARPIGETHSIAELVAHIGGWSDLVRRRIGARRSRSRRAAIGRSSRTAPRRTGKRRWPRSSSEAWHSRIRSMQSIRVPRPTSRSETPSERSTTRSTTPARLPSCARARREDELTGFSGFEEDYQDSCQSSANPVNPVYSPSAYAKASSSVNRAPAASSAAAVKPTASRACAR
ncbi:MAG: DinB family protein [Blastocatellia bacterium]|nr:DinB family protein [Blastocatellia bacterium]